jgi:2-methylcitrate dehydratase
VGQIELETFDVAYNLIGGGEEGNRRMVRSKEEADHSLPYILAVALIDSQVMPSQYQPERIARSDVQALLQKITVRPAEDLSRRFPDEMPCRFTVHLRDGRLLTKEKRNYEGFHSAPIAWDGIVKKFEQLAEPYTSAQLRREIVGAVWEIEAIPVTDVLALLAKIHAA